MGLTNHQEVMDYVRACQDPDHLRVLQHLTGERLAMFNPPAGDAHKEALARPMIAAGNEGFDAKKAQEVQQQRAQQSRPQSTQQQQQQQQEQGKK